MPRILVVEDDPLNNNLICTFMRRAGHEAEGVHGGRDALRRFHEDAFDLVLMDVQMPEMSGTDVMRVMKTAKEDVPVIAVTAYALQGDRESLLAEGFDEYVPKPIDVARLTSVVAEQIAESKKGIS